MVGCGLKVVGSIERDSDLTAVTMPICIVGMPIKSFDVNGSIPLNQLLFHEVMSIQLGIAKLVTRKAGELDVREGAK